MWRKNTAGKTREKKINGKFPLQEQTKQCFSLKIKTQKRGEQHLQLRQTKDSSLISAKLLQFKEEKKSNKKPAMVLQRKSWAKIRPEGNWPLWQFHSGSACPWPFGCSPCLPSSDSSCRGTRHTRSVCCQSSHKSTSLSNQWPFSFLLFRSLGSPVLHNPVVLSVLVNALVSVTHQQHAVVQLLAAAVLVIVDSWRAQDLIRPQT